MNKFIIDFLNKSNEVKHTSYREHENDFDRRDRIRSRRCKHHRVTWPASPNIRQSCCDGYRDNDAETSAATGKSEVRVRGGFCAFWEETRSFRETVERDTRHDRRTGKVSFAQTRRPHANVRPSRRHSVIARLSSDKETVTEHDG